MNAMKNMVQLIGNLGKDPEIRSLDSGRKMARFSLATSEMHKNPSGQWVTEWQWHQMVAWGKVADVAEKYLKKGAKVAIAGKLINRQYNDKDGNRKFITEVQVNELMMMGEKTEKATEK